MDTRLAIKNPLRNLLWSKYSNTWQKAAFILAGVFLLAFASQLSIPLKPIPLTFQSATVILIGMIYGPRYGSYVIASYYAAGLCGLPVFANWSFGILAFAGPTGGYLMGFLPAAWLSGYLAQKGLAKTLGTSFLAACLGTAVIFILGLAFLSQFVGIKNAFTLGLLPFIISEPIKLIVISILIPKLWKQS